MRRDSAPIPRRRVLQLSGCAGALLVAGHGPDAARRRPLASAHDRGRGAHHGGRLTVAQVSGWVAAAHRRLGVRGGALVLFGRDAAFPHGTAKPRPLARGDVVLVDGGGRVHGYQSDVTRTAVFGAPPTDRQRRIRDLVRRAQAAAFEAARPGVECQG